MATIAALVRDRADDHRIGLVFEGRQWTWAEVVQAMADRALWLLDRRDTGPFNVGVLLENTPEFHFWLGAAALCGAAVVGINPTRRGDELARDIGHTDCRLIIADGRQRRLLDGLGLDMPIFEVGDDGASFVAGGAPVLDVTVEESTLFLLLFTSGTTGAPKAVVCTQGRLASIATNASRMLQLTADDVAYCAMPMFHSNALMANWAPVLKVGATLALRRKFSASEFLADVRRMNATFANYVGKPLAYVLATPERPDDADNPLRLVFGNEAGHADVDRFATRFGCRVIDGYGSTEGGVGLTRTSDMPPGAIGVAADNVAILDPETGEERSRAVFDNTGRLSNAPECIGEIVAIRPTGSGFEGYYRNTEATEHKTRGGRYWSGDLGYIDEQRFVYFAGRDLEWIRVDGENFAAAPIERILARYAPVVLAAVYSVPNAIAGDDVMAALQLADGSTFDPAEFEAFLDRQDDLGTKWAPRYVRVGATLPVTMTNKVLKRELQAQRWDAGGPDHVWWRPAKGDGYRPFTALDGSDIEADFAARGRANVLVR